MNQGSVPVRDRICFCPA